MKQLEKKLDFTKVTLKNGQTTKLMCTSSGHYCLSLSRNLIDVNGANVYHIQKYYQTSNDPKEKKTLKLHKQFSHAPKEEFLNVRDYKKI